MSDGAENVCVIESQDSVQIHAQDGVVLKLKQPALICAENDQELRNGNVSLIALSKESKSSTLLVTHANRWNLPQAELRNIAISFVSSNGGKPELFTPPQTSVTPSTVVSAAPPLLLESILTLNMLDNVYEAFKSPAHVITFSLLVKGDVVDSTGSHIAVFSVQTPPRFQLYARNLSRMLHSVSTSNPTKTVFVLQSKKAQAVGRRRGVSQTKPVVTPSVSTSTPAPVIAVSPPNAECTPSRTIVVTPKHHHVSNMDECKAHMASVLSQIDALFTRVPLQYVEHIADTLRARITCYAANAAFSNLVSRPGRSGNSLRTF